MTARSTALAPRAAGLTLMEALVALAVASMLLAVLAGVVGSATAAGAAEERAVGPRRALDLAAELLAEEVGLAGHVPAGLLGGPPAPHVRVSPSTGGHTLTVRFVDDRLAGPAQERYLTFEASPDGRGEPQLYRVAGGRRQPLVEGVVGLAVEAVVDGDGALVPAVSGVVTPRARALVLRLSAAGAERIAVVALPSRPTVEVGP